MSAYARHNADVFSKGPIDGEEVEDTIFLYFFPFSFHFSFSFSLSPSPVVRSLFLQRSGLFPFFPRTIYGGYTEDIRTIHGGLPCFPAEDLTITFDAYTFVNKLHNKP